VLYTGGYIQTFIESYYILQINLPFLTLGAITHYLVSTKWYPKGKAGRYRIIIFPLGPGLPWCRIRGQTVNEYPPFGD